MHSFGVNLKQISIDDLNRIERVNNRVEALGLYSVLGVDEVTLEDLMIRCHKILPLALELLMVCDKKDLQGYIEVLIKSMKGNEIA